VLSINILQFIPRKVNNKIVQTYEA
jgi:hypothetical protein